MEAAMSFAGCQPDTAQRAQAPLLSILGHNVMVWQPDPLQNKREDIRHSN